MFHTKDRKSNLAKIIKIGFYMLKRKNINSGLHPVKIRMRTVQFNRPGLNGNA